MKLKDCQVGRIVYGVWVATFHATKPEYHIRKYVVVLPEHNIVREIMENGNIYENTIQVYDEVFETEADALISAANKLQSNLDKIVNDYKSEIEVLLMKAVKQIEEAV